MSLRAILSTLAVGGCRNGKSCKEISPIPELEWLRLVDRYGERPNRKNLRPRDR